MIPIAKYKAAFEEEYMYAVSKNIDSSEQKHIIDSCKKFLPDDFFQGEGENAFRELVLASFERLKEANEYIGKHKLSIMESECFARNDEGKMELKEPYKSLYSKYEKVADSIKDGASIRVRIVRNTGLTVCPYCNRDYINCRADKVSGAQLDHFYCRAKLPIFAVCIYNLIPVCGNCNRVKSKKAGDFASPFDESIDWKNDIKFSFKGNTLLDVEIKIEGSEQLKANIENMRIDEAYKIHNVEVLELLEQYEIYNNSQKLEFKEVLSKAKLNNAQIKRIIFGHKLTEERMKSKPLGKMLSDFHKQMKIY